MLGFECVQNSERVKKSIDCDKTEDYSYCCVRDEALERKRLLAKKGKKYTGRKKSPSVNL